MLLALIGAGLVIWFFWAAFGRPKAVPGKVQNLGEMGLMFVRDQILRPMMGKQGDGYLPFLVSLFFFIWVMNIMEIIPLAQFPPMSRIAFPVSLMLMVYVTYMYVGIKQHGPGRLLQEHDPQGVPVGILLILAPVEILQYIDRPAVHAGRPAVREHVRRPHPGRCVHHRHLVPVPGWRRPAVQRHLVRADDRADRCSSC